MTVHPLVTVVVFFLFAALVLGHSRARLDRLRRDDADLTEQLADESPWMPEPVAASQASLQVVDRAVGASSRVHTSDFDGWKDGSIRATEAKGAQSL